MRTRSWLLLVAFLSGLAGLGYEIVWTRMLSVGLGHEMPAVLAVVAAFFGGIAAGSWLGERRGAAARVPGRWYAGLELSIGLWSLATVPLVPWVNRGVAVWTGPMPSPLHHWAVAFAAPLVLLFPATFAMGATLPVLARIAAREGEPSRGVAGLYAANTFGAVAGTLLATFLVIPRLGYGATLGCLAAVNVSCAVLALAGTRGARTEAPSAPEPAGAASRSRGLAASLFLTGLLGIGYEVLVVRLLGQVLENTVYSFASALVVYLLGTASGAALYQRFGRRLDGRRLLPFLVTSLSVSCLAGVVALQWADVLHPLLVARLGQGLAPAVAAEMLLASAAFLLPTIAMGATFGLLADEARTRRLGFGGALCVNTLGSALAPFAFGVVALPLLGPKVALLACSLAYLLVLPLRGSWRYGPALVPVGAALILLAAAGPLRLVTLDPGEAVVAHVDGVMAAVTIVRDARDDFHLKVNNRFQMGGTSSGFSDLRQGHIPLLLHPGPRRALYLGLGTAATFAAAADHPGLVADGVELVPEIVPLLHNFRKSTGDLSARKDLSILVADARRYVTATPRRYDVVVADLFHPARDGAGSLYTREHFAAIRSLLEEGGVFCQWLPLYQLDLETLRVITRTFLDVFPEGSAFLAHNSLRQPIVGLVGGAAARAYPPGWFEARVGRDALRERLGRLRLRDDYSLLGGFLAGSESLARFAGDGPLNTDDRPLVIFQAPRFAYAPPQPAHERLLALIGAFSPTPGEVLGRPRNAEDGESHRRLAAYWSARDDFLRAGVGVRETTDARELLAQVRGPLLRIVRESRDFDGAYTPLLALAARLHEVDPEAADRLLAELALANPHRGEASEMARRLSTGR